MGNNDPDAKRAYMRKYYLEHKDKWREYSRREKHESTEAKERRLARRKEYCSRPEVKMRRAEYCRTHQGLQQYAASIRACYGIEYEEYQSLVRAQEGRCAICGNPETRKRLSIDHDHVSGRVRGLLCSACNTGVGFLNDDQSLLKAAIEYLSERG